MVNHVSDHDEREAFIMEETASEGKAETSVVSSENEATDELLTSNDEVMSYQDAMAATAESVDPGEGNSLQIRPTSGTRERFVPKTDLERKVRVYSAVSLSGTGQLSARRTGTDKSQGMLIDRKQITREFGESVFRAHHHEQVDILLSDRRTITGYIMKTRTTQGIYIPVRIVPADIELPQSGTELVMTVSKLIVG